MSMIIIGVDGSQTAMKAAIRAHDLAKTTGASLHVVSAFDNNRTEVFGSGSDTWIVSDADGAEKIAEDTASQLAGAGVDVTYSAARGKPAEALINEAERYSASLIVVGNRGMRGLGRVLGSVANSVSHNAPCDILIVKTVLC